jgi:predicted nucleic-acid-binding Zn-ribbon protein
MRCKECRNCGSTARYSKEVYTRGADALNLLPIGFWSQAKFRIEVCGKCGMVEWFVPERFLAKVKEKFDRVSS